jgi:hypothetical protein
LGEAGIVSSALRLTGKVAIMLVATLIAIGAAEIGLRLFAGDLAGEPVTGNQYQFYRYDPELGWSNQPGARGTFERSEFSFELAINSHGLRGPEITREKPPGAKRVAVLGDSFTWGVGASQADLYTTLVERALPNAQVLNFGVSGYGPIQYFLQTGKVLAFDPDVVVIAFCLGNDFVDNVFWQRYRYYKPFARLDDAGELVIDGYPIPNVKRFPNKYDTGFVKALHDGSYLFRLLDKTLLGLVGSLGNYGQRGPQVSENQKDMYVKPLDAPENDQLVRINAKLLGRIAAAYTARGIPVVVLAVPTKCEFGDCFPDLKEPTDATHRALRRSTEGLPLTLIDPTPSLTLADYWVKDGHWRPSGHRKVADALIPALRNALDKR